MEMMEWIDSTLKAQSADPNIIWKATSQHYPLFGMFYADTEMALLHLMPKLKEHNYDVHFNGHEHQMNYAHAPDSIFNEPKIEQEAISFFDQIYDGVMDLLWKKNCKTGYEWFAQMPEEVEGSKKR
jgi:hypothetical protein